MSFPQFDHDRKCSIAPVVSDHRVIAIGDIHGSYTGLLEDLYYSNITRGRNECVWKEQSTKAVLVQMGDLVDRGPRAFIRFLLNNLGCCFGCIEVVHNHSDVSGNIIVFMTCIHGGNCSF
ncbi:hypothetical protein EON63_05055 [archaeon]|nr:MAG: hypothetical protein EON63_05055 [archaeon]